MKLTFLGTGAANAYPEAFCSCDNCVQARALGGPSLRKRSAALINNDLLIDLGPDIMSAAQQHNAPLTHVRHCLQTHPHSDHLDLSHLQSRSSEYGTRGAPRLTFFASERTLARAATTFGRDLEGFELTSDEARERLNLNLVIVVPWRTFACGTYEITPVPANHAPGMGALLYVVRQDGAALFYATDTAAFPEETWRGLGTLGVRFDLVVFDHTYGPRQTGGGDHMSARDVAIHTTRMRATGLLKPDGLVYATHIAHEGNPPHPELVEHGAQHGYQIAHDGLTIALG